MKRLFPLTAVGLIAATPLFGTGCVQQDRYDELLSSNRSLQEQLVAKDDELESVRANNEMLQSKRSRDLDYVNRLEQENQELAMRVEELGGEIDDLMGQVSDINFGPLPADVESALTDLAQAYPDVLTFDASTGMVRFRSDFTFGLGSTALRAGATRSVNALAQILNSATARGFEVKIVGHTDNVKISKPATRAKHPTNMHLAVHRAIGVREALVNAGVSPSRVMVAGYGPYRPIVANPDRGGAAENRRVDIYLAPMEEETNVLPAPRRELDVEDPPAQPVERTKSGAGGVDPSK